MLRILVVQVQRQIWSFFLCGLRDHQGLNFAVAVALAWLCDKKNCGLSLTSVNGQRPPGPGESVSYSPHHCLVSYLFLLSIRISAFILQEVTYRFFSPTSVPSSTT